MQWAVSVFHAWCDACGVKDATEKMAIEVLADLLPIFIMEAKSRDEILYPQATLSKQVIGKNRALEVGKRNV